MLQSFEYLRTPGLELLEAACGDGMTSHALGTYGHQVTLVDIEDWRDKRCKCLPFVGGNLSGGLDLDSNRFDFTFSFNAFEHLEGPQAALMELLRVTKKEGIVYLSFGPIYPSPWGLHAHRTIRIPYLQYLFSEKFLESKLSKSDIFDLGSDRKALQYVNKWKSRDYEALFRKAPCDVVEMSFLKDLSHLDVVRRFPRAFQGRGLTFEDLTRQAIFIACRKT